MTGKLKKVLLPNLPYLFFVYLFDKLCQAVRLAPGLNASEKLLRIAQGFTEAFSSTAKKYGIDFALKKDTTGEIPCYLVFFKGRDADAVTAAFREFSAKNLAKEKKPSIRRRLTKAKEIGRAHV